MSNPTFHPAQESFPTSFDQLAPQTFDALPLQEWPAQWHPTGRFPTPQSVGNNELRQQASRAISYADELSYYRLGDPMLPIARFREHIVNTILDGNTVLAGPTGCGKTTQSGLYALEAGVPKVYISSPRIIAAREIKSWISHQVGPDYAHLIGYATGMASDSDHGPDTRLFIATEKIIYDIINDGNMEPDALVIHDEAHEHGLHGTMLRGIMNEAGVWTVVSSATIDTEEFAKFHTDPQTGQPAEIIELEGRTFPVQRLQLGNKVGAAVRRHIAAGSNVLAFAAGEGEMREIYAKAKLLNSANVYVLYGDQSPRDQAKALTGDDGNHVIATRVAETSLTPQNKDVVVDSTLSKVGRYEAGKRVLSTEWSSQATMDQRAGRVGRTKPGVYEIAIPSNTPPPPAYEDRPKYDPPAIGNDSVATYVLERLAKGRRIEDMPLPDRPVEANLRYDKLLLQRLGAIVIDTDGTETVTDIGREMCEVTLLDVPLRRMVVESRRIAETMESGDALRLQVAAAVAVRQVRGILDAGNGSMRRYARRKSHQEQITNECKSDLLFELDVFAYLYEKQQSIMASGEPDAEDQFESLLVKTDIRPNRYYKAALIYEELCKREKLQPFMLEKPGVVQREKIVMCHITGAEELFVQRSKYVHADIRGDMHRTLGRRSTIAANLANLVIGTAFDLRPMRETGRFQLSFISGASVVTFDQLRRYAPHRLSRQSMGYGVSRQGRLVERVANYFDGELKINEIETEPAPTEATRTMLIRAMMTGIAPSASNPQEMVPFRPGTSNAALAVRRWKEAQELEHRSTVNLNIARRYESLIKKVIRQSVETVPLDVTDPAELDELIPKVFLNSLVRPTRKKDVPEIVRKSPDGISVHTDEEKKEWLDVSYRNNVAYVTIPRNLKFTVAREDFTELLEHHDVKLRIANGKYQQLDTIFALLDEQRAAEALKRARREEARARVTAMAVTVAANLPANQDRPPRRSKEIMKAASVANAIEIRKRRPPRRLSLVRGGIDAGE